MIGARRRALCAAYNPGLNTPSQRELCAIGCGASLPVAATQLRRPSSALRRRSTHATSCQGDGSHARGPRADSAFGRPRPAWAPTPFVPGPGSYVKAAARPSCELGQRRRGARTQTSCNVRCTIRIDDKIIPIDPNACESRMRCCNAQQRQLGGRSVWTALEFVPLLPILLRRNPDIPSIIPCFNGDSAR